METSLFSRWFWVDTAERVASSAATAVASLLGATSFDVIEADYQAIAATAAITAVVTFMKCVSSIRAGEPGTPSLVV